jgi:hypothetical protein
MMANIFLAYTIQERLAVPFDITHEKVHNRVERVSLLKDVNNILVI